MVEHYLNIRKILGKNVFAPYYFFVNSYNSSSSFVIETKSPLYALPDCQNCQTNTSQALASKAKKTHNASFYQSCLQYKKAVGYRPTP